VTPPRITAGVTARAAGVTRDATPLRNKVVSQPICRGNVLDTFPRQSARLAVSHGTPEEEKEKSLPKSPLRGETVRA
jgi:hypothetical protein